MGRPFDLVDGRNIAAALQEKSDISTIFYTILSKSCADICIGDRIVQTDDIDRRILRHYLPEPDAGRAVIAGRAGVTQVTLARRLDRLREAGVIGPARAQIIWRKLGFEVEVSLRFTLDKTAPRAFDDFIEAARLVPEVVAIETFLGRVDVRLNVIARDMVHWQEVYRARILALPHISELEALMLISTIKDSDGLAL
jgi:Lrp/AsnC family transcriptional regulator